MVRANAVQAKARRAKKPAKRRRAKKPAAAGDPGGNGAARKNGKAAVPDGIYVPTQAMVAWFFHVNVETVQNWIKNQAPPKTSDGYDLRVYYEWLRRRNTGGEVDAALDQRLKAAKLAILEIKARREAEAVIDVKLAREERGQVVRWAVGVFDRAGPELAPKLAGRKPGEIKRIVTDYFDAVRWAALGEKPGKG